MLLAFIVIISIIAVAVFLLLTPIILNIDTRKKEYSIHWKYLAKASLEPHKEELLRVKVKVLFFKFYFNPMDEFFKNRRVKKLKTNKPITKRRKHFDFYKGLKVLKTCKIKRFAWELDTGNVITNAKLYPPFAMLNYYVGGFNINFEGRNYLSVCIQNRPINILKLFINP